MIDVEVRVSGFRMTFTPVSRVGADWLQFRLPDPDKRTVHDIEGYELVAAMERTGIRFVEQ